LQAASNVAIANTGIRATWAGLIDMDNLVGVEIEDAEANARGPAFSATR
jgi:hypothetical protein